MVFMRNAFFKKIYQKYLNNFELLNPVGLNLIIKSSALILGILSSRWLFSYLPKADLNSYFLIIAYTSVILQSLNFGVYSLIQKFYTNKEYENSLPDIWATFSVFKFFTYFLGLISVLLTYDIFLSIENQRIYYILIIFTAQFFLEIDNNYRAVCNSRNRAWQFSFTDFISKVLLLIILYSFSFLIQDQFLFNFYVWTIFVVNFISLIVDYLWQKKDTKWGTFRFSIFKKNLPTILVLVLSTVFLSLYENTDRLFLEYFNSSSEVIVGYSNAYLNVFEKSKIIVSMSVPMIASFVKRGFDKNKTDKIDNILFDKIFLKGFALIVFLAFSTYLASTLFGPLILFFIDSENKYTLSLKVLPFLTVSIIPYFIYLFFSILVTFKNGEKWMLLTEFLSLILALVLYYFLIGSFSLYGAAVATFIVYTFKMLLNISFFFFLYKPKTL